MASLRDIKSRINFNEKDESNYESDADGFCF